MNGFAYGQAVDFDPVLRSEKSMRVFIPRKFPWESGEKTEIVLNKDFRIRATEDAKLLIQTEKGIREMDIPFSGERHEKSCDLRAFLKENRISFEEADGRYCDETVWNQKESAEKVCYCKSGMLSVCCGPYWGNQYEFYFADKKRQPVAGGRSVKILRFSYCKERVWPQAQKSFMYMMQKKRSMDMDDLCRMGEELNGMRSAVNACRMYLQDGSGIYQWYDLA